MENPVDDPTGLRIARDLRGVSGADLAEAVGVTPAAISHYETGRSKPSKQVAAALARYLEVPTDLVLSASVVSSSPFHYRGPGEPPARSKRQLSATAALLGRLVSGAVRARKTPTDDAQLRLPVGDLGATIAPALTSFRAPPSGLSDPAFRAALFREKAELSGPLPDVVAVLEGLGVFVHQLPPEPAEHLYYAAMWVGKQAHAFLNTVNRDAYQARYDGAEALAHLLLGKTEPDVVERSRLVHTFADALMLPRAAWSADPCSAASELTHFAEARVRWRVPVIRMLRRSHDLGLLSERRYYRLTHEYDERGWRSGEPGAKLMQHEAPRGFGALIGWWAMSESLQPNQLAEQAGVPTDLLRDHSP